MKQEEKLNKLLNQYKHQRCEVIKDYSNQNVINYKENNASKINDIIFPPFKAKDNSNIIFNEKSLNNMDNDNKSYLMSNGESQIKLKKIENHEKWKHDKYNISNEYLKGTTKDYINVILKEKF